MNLNPEQQKAVEHFTGPLIVIAGAGSGKTRVITERIIHLINHHTVDSKNILALTFTNKAADEMRSRIEASLAAAADDMQISTFHSFCTSLLQEYGSHIGIPRDFKTINGTYAQIILTAIFRKLIPKYFIEQYKPKDTIYEINQFISRAKDELIISDDLKQFINSKRLQFEKCKNLLKPDDREAQELEIQRLEALTALYSEYQIELSAQGALDYGDQIMLSAKLLKERPNILHTIQNRFTHILVDEFQDTNIAQIEILHLISKRHRNICVVGDDDQAIYRFRGASYASFKKFQELFPERTEILLNTNYRSTQNILNLASTSIRNNAGSRLYPDKILVTQNEPGFPVQCFINPSNEHEAYFIANLLEERINHNKQNNITETMAVLYRNHIHAKSLLKACKQRTIPYTIINPELLFDQPEVKLIISFMRLLNHSDDLTYLFSILEYPDWKITGKDWTILRDAYQDQTLSPLEFLLNNSCSQYVSQTALYKLNNLKLILSELSVSAETESIVELVQHIITKTRLLLNLLLESSKTADKKINNIRALYNFICENTENDENQKLHTFIEFFDDYLLAGGDPGVPNETAPEPHTINFLTVHSAKGLEFDVVYLIALSSRKFPTPEREEIARFPQELMKEEIPLGDVHEQEERRLFYVALTRAKKELYLSGIRKKRTQLSKFINEIANQCTASGILEMIECSPIEQEISIQQLTPPSEKPTLTIKKEILNILNSAESSPDKSVIDAEQIKKDIQTLISGYCTLAHIDMTNDQIKNALTSSIETLKAPAEIAPKEEPEPEIISKPLKLSFSQIETYQHCPLQYKFRYIYRITAPKAPAASFGQTIHSALQEFYTKIKNGEPVSLQTLLDLYEQHWDTKVFKDKMIELSYKQKGINQLTQFYETNKDNLRPPLHLEKIFQIQVNETISLNGKIDRIDPLNSGSIEIIDYKTGKKGNSKEDKEERELQMSIYALAVEKLLGVLPEKLTFYYLESSELLSLTKNPNDIKETITKIEAIASHIASCEFPTKEEYHCSWCDYQWLCPAKQIPT
jgi:DNA helicase-2/ATP-dependent DNA helicase PcrA